MWAPNPGTHISSLPGYSTQPKLRTPAARTGEISYLIGNPTGLEARGYMVHTRSIAPHLQPTQMTDVQMYIYIHEAYTPFRCTRRARLATAGPKFSTTIPQSCYTPTSSKRQTAKGQWFDAVIPASCQLTSNSQAGPVLLSTELHYWPIPFPLLSRSVRSNPYRSTPRTSTHSPPACRPGCSVRPPGGLRPLHGDAACTHHPVARRRYGRHPRSSPQPRGSMPQRPQ